MLQSCKTLSQIFVLWNLRLPIRLCPTSESTPHAGDARVKATHQGRPRWIGCCNDGIFPRVRPAWVGESSANVLDLGKVDCPKRSGEGRVEAVVRWVGVGNGKVVALMLQTNVSYLSTGTHMCTQYTSEGWMTGMYVNILLYCTE